MPKVAANGIEIEFESFGSPDSETVLLIMGLGVQLTMWPIELCVDLVARGFRVMRFDNRDVGLSTKFTEHGLPDFDAIERARTAGEALPIAYGLSDMAQDAIGLIDALGIQKAHIVGASMGGMIAQHIAADYPDRVRSVTLIMTTAGSPEMPLVSPAASEIFAPPPAFDAQSVVEHTVKTSILRGSPGYPTLIEDLRTAARTDYERCYDPSGAARQTAAVFADPDRSPKLRAIRARVVVIHGADDPVFPLEAAKHIAAHIPNVDLRIVPGMGHDVPVALVPLIGDAIASAAGRDS